jgi:hypothetical protein
LSSEEKVCRFFYFHDYSAFAYLSSVV